MLNDSRYDFGKERANISVQILPAIASTISHNAPAAYVVRYYPIQHSEDNCTHVIRNNVLSAVVSLIPQCKIRLRTSEHRSPFEYY
jgi:hypothetical protein